MTRRGSRTAAGLAAALALAGSVSDAGQQLPSEPARQFGASITPSYEGWFDNADGSHTFLVGYLNRNRAQEVDVPIGPNNRIEPGGPDLGQPTHFLPGRQTGMFTVTVPKEFTPDQRVTWTITVNGQTNSIPFRLHTDYSITPFRHTSVGNTPPSVRFVEKGPGIQGPIATALKIATSLTAAVSKPLPLVLWTDDDAKYSTGTGAPLSRPRPPVSISWSKYRGPGKVVFEKARPELEALAGGAVGQPYRGKGTTTATFDAAGEYVLHVTANDYSGEGGGGELCCWTTALVRVTVLP
jgi:hypothetical protein